MLTAPFKITPLDGWMAEKMGILDKRLNRKELANYQLSRLNDTIGRARSISPFYREHLAGVSSERLLSLNEFRQYPLLTSEDIAGQALKMICIPQSQINRVVTINTSGTTGVPKKIYFSKSDQQLSVDFFGCGMSTFLTGAKDKALILMPGKRPGSVGDLIYKALIAIGVEPIAYGLVEDLAGAVSMMCSQKATCLIGLPVQVLAMARYWEQFAKESWSPKFVLLSADYIPEAVLTELRRIWDCEIYEHYGMTEMGLGGGLECQAHNGYHLREDDLYFEVIDPITARPLGAGEYGEIVFTTLTRRAMPLIRYRTGDISRIMLEKCPCGSILSRLDKVCYRQEELVYLSQDDKLSMADLDESLLPVLGIVDFTAEIIYSEIKKMKIGLVVLNRLFFRKPNFILNILRQIPAIKKAEERGELVLEIEFFSYQEKKVFAIGKRKIQPIGRARS